MNILDVISEKGIWIVIVIVIAILLFLAFFIVGEIREQKERNATLRKQLNKYIDLSTDRLRLIKKLNHEIRAKNIINDQRVIELDRLEKKQFKLE